MAEADAPATLSRRSRRAPGACSPSSPPPAWPPSRPAGCAAHRWRAAAAAAAPAAERPDMSLSSWDDYPVHQAAEFIAHPATSDRNFYDRYYFNMHPCDDDWFAIFGFGQYPNLGVVDAFIDVRHGGSQHVVRSSAPLVDRGDISVGPFRVEVLEPLRRLRVIVEPTEHTWPWTSPGRATSPPWRSPASTLRSQGQGRLRHPAAGPDRDAGRGRSRSAASTSPSRPTAAGAPATARGACARSASPRPTASARASSSWAACGTTSRCSSTTTPSCTSATSATTASVRWCRAERVWIDPDRGVDDLGRSEHEHHLDPRHPGHRPLGGALPRGRHSR